MRIEKGSGLGSRCRSPDRRGAHRGAIAFDLETIRWLELHSDAGIERRLGAGAVAHGNGAQSGSAGQGPVVIEAELVLPVAVRHPNINEVGVFWPPNRLRGVEGQSDRFRVELDLPLVYSVRRLVRQRLVVSTLPAVPGHAAADGEVVQARR